MHSHSAYPDRAIVIFMLIARNKIHQVIKQSFLMYVSKCLPTTKIAFSQDALKSGALWHCGFMLFSQFLR